MDRWTTCPDCAGEGGWILNQEEANAIMCAPGLHLCDRCQGEGILETEKEISWCHDHDAAVVTDAFCMECLSESQNKNRSPTN